MTVEDDRAEQLRQRYLANQVETSTPAQRLLMLLGRVLQDLRAAEEAFETTSIEVVHCNLVHAQEIVLVLRDSLNGSDWSGAQALRAVYGFVHQRLVTCNVTKDPSLLPMCVKLIGQVLDANVQAAAIETGQVVGVGVGQVA
jgi:flagellar secretion chaperone FliS